jgi:opacity protein-like surface antigen
MKAKIIALSLLLSVSSVCCADTTGYLSLRSGVSNIHWDPDEINDKFSDTVANVAFAGGANIRGDVVGGRVELEWTHYFKAEDKSFGGKLDLDTLIVNGYLDLYPAEWMNFYLTAGGGTRWSKVEYCGRYCASDRSHGGAFQAGAGFMFNFNRNLSLDLGYRYARLASDAYSHNAQLGFTFNF